MQPKIERVTESVTLAEAPHWDPSTKSLYYVDIMGTTIHKYTPATKKCVKASVGLRQVSFIIPIDGQKNQFIISGGKEVIRIHWDGESSDVTEIEKLAQVENNVIDLADNRFNDGKCDPSGRLWAGTLNTRPEGAMGYPAKGTLYTLDSDRKVKSHLTNLRISNGMAFDCNNAKMYFIDSLKQTVDQYDFDIKSGTISNLKVVFTLNKHQINGIPDGMTIDTEGNLWVAIFNGNCVIKIDPNQPETLLSTIKMPVKQVTSVAFGGDNLDELYVTTGAFKMDSQDEITPESGCLFKITNIGAKGLAGDNFRLKIN